ncbi:MAG: hypothetical protein IT285_13820 [Bdellovibrionales bacterium]|nr:hypothetical protein [Bdellovibrionales bacterium]
MMKRMTWSVGILFLACAPSARAEWFCKEGASERQGSALMACGVETDAAEAAARKKALAAAFEELDAICDRSVDCRDFELEIEPLRTDCREEKGRFKCYRAIRASITGKKRSKPYEKGQTLQADREKLDVTVRIDPRDLAALMQPQAPAGEAKKDAKPRCPSDLTALSQSLLDISTTERQQAMAREAVKVPLSELCAPIHYRVLSVLGRHGIELPAYSAFLLQEIDQIADPTADPRAEEVLDYFHRLGPLTETQWKSGFSVVRRAQTYGLYRLLPRIFYDQAASKGERALEQRRVDLLVEAVRKGELGKPVPLKLDDAMELLLRALRSHRTRGEPWLAAYAYEKYREGLAYSAPHKLARSLKSLGGEATDPGIRSASNAWLAELAKKAQPSYELSRVLVDVLNDFESDIKKQDDEEEEGIRKIAELRKLRAALIAGAGGAMGKNLAITNQEYERKSRTLLCLDLQIECPGLVPDADRLSHLLKSKKGQKRTEALEILLKMPKVATRLEPDLVATLRDVDEGKVEGAYDLPRRTLQVLAEIPTDNKDALRLAVDMHLRSRLTFQDVREKLGSNLEPFLLTELQKGSQRHHLRILMELEEFPQLAKPTCRHLETLTGDQLHYSVRDAAEKARRRCR